MPPFVDITGQQFGHWTALTCERTDKGPVWNCVCKCGRQNQIPSGRLRAGASRQCRSCATSGQRNFTPAIPAERIRRKVSKTGYIDVRVWEGHPWWEYAYRHTKGRQREGLEHRLVVAEHLGRRLHRYETVHHIDGDRQNNMLGNLQLRKFHHGPGQLWQCRTCGSHDVGTVEI